jgi:polyribonucleotide 5'-hydroxyl-kinase
MMSDSHFDGMQPDIKEWVLEPETEYRFELDPGTSLAIKVSWYATTRQIHSRQPHTF